MRIKAATTSGVVCFALAFAARTTPAEPQASPAPRILGTAQSEQEFDAYSAVVTTREPRALIQAAEQFVQRYPDSGLAAYVHQSATQAYYQLTDMAQVIRHGELALRDLHGNAVLLGLVSAAYLDRRQPEKAADRATAALHAIAKMELPQGADRIAWRAQVNALDSAVHLTLGSALLEMSLHASAASDTKRRLAEATASLAQALAKNPASAEASYRLAMALDAQADSDNALRYYAWTVALGGAQADSADTKLEELCQSRGRSAKDAVASARAEIERGSADLRAPDSQH
jgi:tetratricopeptide (TPR) repeat protein